MPYLYIAKPRYRDGPCKIGITHGSLEKRLSSLQTGYFEELEFAIIIECDKPRQLELQLHREFIDYRIRGEWFATHDNLIERINTIEGAACPLGTWLKSETGWRPSLRWSDGLPSARWH